MTNYDHKLEWWDGEWQGGGNCELQTIMCDLRSDKLYIITGDANRI